MEAIKLMVVLDENGQLDVVTTCGKKIDGVISLKAERDFDSVDTVSITAYAYKPDGNFAIS